MNTTKKRANGVIQTEINGNTMIFRIGEFLPLSIDISKLHPDVLARAAVHGMKQRIADAAAIPCDPETGKPADALAKWNACNKLVEHYNSGTADWGIRRAAGEPRESGGMVVSAIARVKGWAVGEVEKKLQPICARTGMDMGKLLKHMATSTEVAAEIGRMKAAKSGVDVDGLLAEMGD